MKKIIAFILATVMLMATLTACGSKGNDEKKGGAKTAADLKIVLLLPGEINDQAGTHLTTPALWPATRSWAPRWSMWSP